MRHLKAGRKLGRNASHRLALMRNLSMALIRHERIITTLEKAKEARRFVEKLITLAKKGTLHARRLALARLGPAAHAEVKPGDDANADHRTVLVKLFSDLGPRFAERPGGYTRVIKRHERRLGDGGRTAFLELLKEGETKVQARRPAPAPAPQVEPPEEEERPEDETEAEDEGTEDEEEEQEETSAEQTQPSAPASQLAPSATAPAAPAAGSETPAAPPSSPPPGENPPKP
jgi:large subunit ribosomal protein L17